MMSATTLDVLSVVTASERPLTTLEIASSVGVTNHEAGCSLRRLADQGLVRRVGFTQTVRQVRLWERV